MRRALLLALALLVVAGEARATYPDLEAWAESPPSGWNLYCSETLDNSDTYGGTSGNPSSSTTKQCPSGSSSGGTALISNNAGWSQVTIGTAGITVTGTGPTRVLKEAQSNDSTGNIGIFPFSYSWSSGGDIHLCTRHYRWYSSDATAIHSPISGKSRKMAEMNMGPTGTASWSGGNQLQIADWKDDAGNWNAFYSNPGTDCDINTPRVEGSNVTLDDCKVPYGCRVEQCFTWDGTTATFEHKITQLGSGGEVKFDRRLGSCTPSVAPTTFKTDSNGAWVNFNVNMTGETSGLGDTFVSMVVGAYRTDASTNTWIGPAVEIEGAGSAPTAACSCTPTSGTATLSVSCTDESTGSPTSWAYDVYPNGGAPNGTDSTSQNPTFNLAAGTWAIQLTATNGSGSSSPVECTGSPITVSAPAAATYCCLQSP